MSKKIRIGLDIDEVLADFMGEYRRFFNADKNPKMMQQEIITKNVHNLRNNKEFWENLPFLDNGLNFDPILYCTKRVNSKTYTKNWLKKNNLPDVPVYQMYNYQGNKATMIKGRVDVFIDDSISNVMKCLNSGVPALILDTPYNQSDDPAFRIYSLDKEEILEAYHLMKEYL